MSFVCEVAQLFAGVLIIVLLVPTLAALGFGPITVVTLSVAAAFTGMMVVALLEECFF